MSISFDIVIIVILISQIPLQSPQSIHWRWS